MSVDITKFPLLDSENTKLPLDAPPYRSRIKNFYVEDVDTKNYIGTAFRNIGDIIQAGELNEIYERQLLNDTLTHQMWSNWSSFIFPPEGTPLSPPPSFGPGWAGTTPLYPGEFDANSTALAGAEVILDSRPYSQVEAAVLFKTIDNDDNGSGQLEADIKLLFNTGWYLISDNTFVTPELPFAGLNEGTLHDRVVQSSGLKHWYYLDTPILFDVGLAGPRSPDPQGSPKLSMTITDQLVFASFSNSSKVVGLQLGSSDVTSESLDRNIRDTHDGAYFALNLAQKSLCEHIDLNCQEDLTNGGSVSDTNPIQTTGIINDTFFANPLDPEQTEGSNSRRVQIKAVPTFRQASNHSLAPLYSGANSLGTLERAKSTNILLGNMNLSQSFPSFTYQDKVPSYSLCVKCEKNTEATTQTIKDLNNYIANEAPYNGAFNVPSDNFDATEVKRLRDIIFTQMKDGFTPRFINNVRVNATIYDVDVQGDTDAENEWNSHFSELGDAITIVQNTDLRQIEPI